MTRNIWFGDILRRGSGIEAALLAVFHGAAAWGSTSAFAWVMWLGAAFWTVIAVSRLWHGGRHDR